MAISRWFHSVEKGVMSKVEGKGGQVEGGLTKNKVEQNTISLPLSPTNVCPSVVFEGEDYDLKVSINATAHGSCQRLCGELFPTRLRL